MGGILRILNPSAVKVVILFVALALAPWQTFVDRAHEYLALSQPRRAAAFLAIASVCVIAFVVTPFIARATLRIPLLALTFGLYAAGAIFYAVSGHDLDAGQVAMLWREKAMAANAIDAYFWAGAPTAAWLLLAAAVLASPPGQRLRLRAYWAAIPIAASGGCIAMVLMTDIAVTEFPLSFGTPAFAIAAATSEQYSGPRDEVPQSPPVHPNYRNVVMIVDESIRGDYVEINNPGYASAPFLTALGERLINFGTAVSGHNCSAAARAILRWGLQPADIPGADYRLFRTSTIWQYAHQAGFKTILVDAFAEVLETHSYMTPVERTHIDRTVTVDDDLGYFRDQHIASTILPETLAGTGRQFIYVNKFGVHFPYQQKYPPDFDNESGPPHDDLDNRPALVESYRRAVKWSVDEFFRTLLGKVDLRDTIIFYTSDHGQSLLDGYYKQTHCSNGTVVFGEGIVPMLAFAGDGPLRLALQERAKARFGKATHFDLFPSLLVAMGYDENWVLQHYGASLFRLPATRHRRFFIGDLFEKEDSALWVSVD